MYHILYVLLYGEIMDYKIKSRMLLIHSCWVLCVRCSLQYRTQSCCKIAQHINANKTDKKCKISHKFILCNGWWLYLVEDAVHQAYTRFIHFDYTFPAAAHTLSRAHNAACCVCVCVVCVVCAMRSPRACVFVLLFSCIFNDVWSLRRISNACRPNIMRSKMCAIHRILPDGKADAHAIVYS